MELQPIAIAVNSNTVVAALAPGDVLTVDTPNDASWSDSAYASKTPTGASDLSDDEIARPAPVVVTVTPRKRQVSGPADFASRPAKQPRVHVCDGIQVRPPAMVNPKSVYEGHARPLPLSKELDVIDEFMNFTETQHPQESYDDSYFNYRLDQFRVYFPGQPRPPGRSSRQQGQRHRATEMTMLSVLSVKGGVSCVMVDGILCSDSGARRYIECIPVDRLSVGNYADSNVHAVEDCVWLQSELARAKGLELYYQLGTPAPEYERYYRPFLWLANFAKYFLDFVEDINGDVTLQHFRGQFCLWAIQTHGGSASFRAWHAEFGRDDFRNAVAVHRDWLWNQTYNLPEAEPMRNLTVWKEVRELSVIPPAVPPSKVEYKTVVTPYVYDCFSRVWPDGLKKVTTANRNSHMTSLVFDRVEVPVSRRLPRDKSGRIPPQEVNPQVGDVVAFAPDKDTKWRGAGNAWYAYIQAIHGDKLSLIWLYTPSDTILAGEKYPYQNELFFSDHCNCNESETSIDEVLYILPTSFFVGPNESNFEFFIRQKYRTFRDPTNPSFITLKLSDLKGCACTSETISDFEVVKSKYSTGDTVLVEICSMLEPAEIICFDNGSQRVELRVLQRRNRLEPARPNELLYTHTTTWTKPGLIKRRCQIRMKSDNLPASYTRDGAGDFYIMSGQLKGGDILPLASTTLQEGYDPTATIPGKLRMNGLDLFCGGGNFGRGIEEGGAVHMKWAVDIESVALHAYRANLANVDDTAMYLGSINNYVQDAILGRYSDTVASPDDVDFISAGSPCQGFSNANQDKDSQRSLENSSLLASVCSAVDVFRPRYALLENVTGMAKSRKWPSGVMCNVFRQVVCCIVGLGYQCQQWTLDSWSYGNPQMRTRLFLCVAAPGESLPPRPPRTHQHPLNQRDQALSAAPNGSQFGGRELDGSCPFNFVSAGAGFGDLPDIADAHVGACIPFPDHRTSRNEDWDTRKLMAHVPRAPSKLGWRQAIAIKRMPEKLQWYLHGDKVCSSKLNINCRSWSRISEHQLCRTITTSLTPQCSFTGTWVHWEQHRCITVMEARRAQGFPDEEVLIGGPAQAFKIVGNSVARAVSLAWGLSVREAWLNSDQSDETPRRTPDNTLVFSDEG